MQKGFTPLLLLFGMALLIAIAGGVYYFTTLQSKPAISTPTPQPSPTSTQQTITPSPTPTPSDRTTVCIQVITPAKNTSTGECREYPTPCDVPSGWEKVTSCNSTTHCPTPPPCKGNLVYGDPAPTDPNQCPRYQCI